MLARYRHDQQIGQRDDPAVYWYQVISGAVRQYTVQPDGRRQIVDLLLPGDFFGFAAPDMEPFVTEAIVDGTVLASYHRQRLELLADSDPCVARGIRDGAFDAISRMQRQLLVLGRVKASEKVGSFLLKLADRLCARPGDEVRLPVSRYDIADYLAISVETVSRSMTDLQRRGAIRLEGTRQVKIVDRHALDMPAAERGSRPRDARRKLPPVEARIPRVELSFHEPLLGDKP